VELSRLRSLMARGPGGIEGLHTVEDFRAAAKHRLPKMVFDFVDGGADGEISLAANRRALDDVLFSPRFMVDVADRDQTTNVFGRPVSSPLILSPSGLATVVHPDGELAVARAAADAGLIFAISTGSGYSMEEIAEQSNGRLWFQLYLWKSEQVIQSLISRAKNSGYEALIVTVDVPVVGKRERDLRNGMSLPVRVRPKTVANTALRLPWLWRMLNGPEITFGSLVEIAPGDDASSIGEYTSRELTDPTRTWEDLSMIRRRWDGPLLVKGVMTPGDALAAVANGADGVIVSNHGGRQISSVPGTAEVFLDGGIRRGEDIVKARAMGATAASGGRLWFWGLAAGGEQGVRRVLSILEADVDRTLALVGQRRFDDVSGADLYRKDSTT
jgi:L-lactate dehydrogenase (cytochrome)